MVRGAIDAIGGIGRFVQRGDVVVIKPNVAFERPAVLGATTHPEVLTALIHLVREAGAAEIRVADTPIESPQSWGHAPEIFVGSFNHAVLVVNFITLLAIVFSAVRGTRQE